MVTPQSKQMIFKKLQKRIISRIGWYATVFVVVSWPLYLRARSKQSKAMFQSPSPGEPGEPGENRFTRIDSNVTLVSLSALQETLRNLGIRHSEKQEKRRLVPKMQLVEGKSKIKGVHFFLDSSPITFWEEFQEEKVKYALDQIVKDGFNTVILVYPWSGLQVNAHDNLYDPWMYQRIIRLLNMIDDSGLYFINRVGYTHNLRPGNTPKGSARCSYVMLDEDAALNRWGDYLKSLETIFENFDSYLYSFFSWEDFFCGKSMMESSENQRIKNGKASKFNHAIPVNDGSNPEHVRLWYDHMNVKWMNMLDRGQSVMSKLTMEIRIDSDPVLVGTGVEWFGYSKSGPVPRHARAATYFSPYFGQENNGLAVEAEDVAQKLEFMLREVAGERFAVKETLLNQFNFVDNTPGFLRSSNYIAEYDVVNFLHKSETILQNLTSGYALWAYHNYRENSIFNGSFQRGLFGWKCNRTTNMKFDGTFLHIYGPASLNTTFNLPDNRCDGEGIERHICFRSSSHNCRRVQICLNDVCEDHQVSKDTSNSCTSVKSGGMAEFHLSISIGECQAKVGDVEAWCHEQNLAVRHVDGSPGPFLSSIRRLNRALT